ncbi:NUDIX domain-containing protein [Actinopolymorpha pittospori]|nr:NUDIX domain-containing protein [Actinopolymorpha pittospori]
MSSGSADRVSGGVSGGGAPARVLGVSGPADHQQTDAAPVIVVGAAIVRDARLLAQQRAFPEQLAGRWELPGGRVEPGESDRDAVVRECEEELGVRVVVHDQVGPEVPLRHGRMVLRIYAASLTEPEAVPVAREHRAVRWVEATEIPELDWLDADLALVPHLCDLLPA